MMLSKREKILIMLLIFFVASLVLYKFIPLKIEFNLSGVKQEHQNVSMNYEAMAQNIKLIKTYEEKEKLLLREIEELSILPAINQEEQIELLNRLLSESKIKISKLTFSEIMMVSDDFDAEKTKYSETDYDESKTKQSETKKSNLKENDMILMSANIQFVADYNDMLLCINKLQSNTYNIVIKNIQALYEDDGSVNCTMDISFYALEHN